MPRSRRRSTLAFAPIAFALAFDACVAVRQSKPSASTKEHVVQAYQTEFDATIAHPALYHPPTGTCRQHSTSTAYVNRSGSTSTLLTMYLSRDGTEVLQRSQSTAVTPAGTFRVLV